MSRRSVHFRDVFRRLKPWSSFAIVALALGHAAGSDPTDGKPAEKAQKAEKPKADPRLEGYRVPAGFKLKVVAAEPALLDPVAMTFDDHGNVYVAEWRPAERTYETRDTVTSPEGDTTHVRRTRKSATDVVKKLRDADGDGVYESSEVVLEGCEMPTSLFLWRESLYLTCVGRFEKWSDDDGDGRFESRTVLLNGFAAMDRRGLGGATLGLDGWVYLATGDNDNHVVGPDDSRVDLERTGGIVRCRPDGSRLARFAMGLRNPFKGLGFDGHFDPFLIDGDNEDGSKLQGLRLVNPTEEGDYGWRLRAGSTGALADFDRASANGEAPGTLPVLARLGRGTASGLVAYNGPAFSEVMRDILVLPDPSRRIVRGFKVESKGGSRVYRGESTLMTADDEQFRPVQVAVGADGALYVLDQRGGSPLDRPPGGEGKAGRLYRITGEVEKDKDKESATKPRPNHWDRIVKASTEEIVFKYLTSPDHGESERAMRELVERGQTSLVHFIGWASNVKAPAYSRLIAVQGARQLWNDRAEAAMLALLDDPEPDVRRVAAQGLGWEPKEPLARLVPKLVPHLDDADVRVVREVALAIGRHAEARPQQASAVLLRWLIAHPQAEASVKDALIRALERLGDAGIEEVALAIRTRRGVEREAAVALFTQFRTAPAAERLEGLVKVPDLSDAERIALIRHFATFPPDVQASTQGLVDWLVRHSDVEPPVKIAALDACRQAGNPASSLVVRLLDDEDDAVRQAAMRIASRSRPPKAVEILLDRLKAKDTPSSERLALVKALRFAGPKAFDGLDAAYLASEDPEFRQAALRSMADSDRSRATAALEATLSGPDPAIRALAARIMAESPKTATLLGKAFTGRNVQREELPIVLEGLRKHDSRENRKILAAIEEDASSGAAAINPAEVRDRVEQGYGNPWAGLNVFFRSSARCSTCHAVAGRGANFGPALTLTSSSPPLEGVIDSILSPSKAVNPRFEARKLTLKDGRSGVGIITARDEKTIVVREPGGREVRLGRDQIDREAGEPGSAMPAHIALDLTPDEIVDLVAFLRSKPAQDALKHGPKRVDKILAIGPFPLGADRLRVPLDRVDTSRNYEGQEGAGASWISLEATHHGLLNLRGEMAAKPGRAYLAAEVQSTAGQTAALRFAIEGACRVYLNGSRVADVPEPEPSTLTSAFAKPASLAVSPLPGLARLDLKAGSNLLLIAIDRTDDVSGDVRALLEVASPEPVEVSTPRK